MSINWDVEALAKLTPLQRHRLWLNANRLGNDDVVSMIEASGLSYTDPSGLKLDSPFGRAMTKIVYSANGKAAAIEATQKGLSFPKIISGRIDDAVRPRSEWRQWLQTVGRHDARAHLSVMPNACTLDCNTPHRRKEFAASAPRRR